MLPAAARLRRRQDFAATVRQGRRATRRTIVVSLARPPGVDATAPPLVGFAVSRTVGGAVMRNRVTRRLRHLLRDRLDQLPGGSRLVVRALPAAATTDYPTLAHDLDVALAKLTSGPR